MASPRLLNLMPHRHARPKVDEPDSPGQSLCRRASGFDSLRASMERSLSQKQGSRPSGGNSEAPSRRERSPTNRENTLCCVGAQRRGVRPRLHSRSTGSGSLCHVDIFGDMSGTLSLLTASGSEQTVSDRGSMFAARSLVAHAVGGCRRIAPPTRPAQSCRDTFPWSFRRVKCRSAFEMLKRH